MCTAVASGVQCLEKWKKGKRERERWLSIKSMAHFLLKCAHTFLTHHNRHHHRLRIANCNQPIRQLTGDSVVAVVAARSMED